MALINFVSDTISSLPLTLSLALTLSISMIGLIVLHIVVVELVMMELVVCWSTLVPPLRCQGSRRRERNGRVLSLCSLPIRKHG